MGKASAWLIWQTWLEAIFRISVHLLNKSFRPILDTEKAMTHRRRRKYVPSGSKSTFVPAGRRKLNLEYYAVLGLRTISESEFERCFSAMESKKQTVECVSKAAAEKAVWMLKKQQPTIKAEIHRNTINRICRKKADELVSRLSGTLEKWEIREVLKKMFPLERFV